MVSSETPTIRQPGMNPALARWNRPGSSFRRDRSPVAPTRTTTCGYLGPTRDEFLAKSRFPSVLAHGGWRGDDEGPACGSRQALRTGTGSVILIMRFCFRDPGRFRIRVESGRKA